MPNPGFLLAEDSALKKRLQYLHVTDDRNARRPVKVFFRYPEGETEKEYPFVTIDLLDIGYDTQRQLSDVTYFLNSDPNSYSSSLTYYPSEYSSSDLLAMSTSGYLYTEQFVAVTLMYQVSVFCRSQRHDRELTAAMLRYVFPFRQTSLHVPEDNTVRRLALLDWRTADLLDQEAGYRKRVFRKVYTISITAEMPQSDLLQAMTVLELRGTLNDYDPDSIVPTPTLSEDF